jgi:ParB-like chromosome segregation protein Spo0J
MDVERVSIDSISHDPANLRLHPERNVAAIKASLRRFGQQKPIVVDGKGVVRAGNGTLQAARELGWSEIAIVRTDLEGVEAVAYAIADNRTAELAEWNVPDLATTLESFRLADFDLSLVGFTTADLDALLGKLSSGIEGDDLNNQAQILPLPSKFEIIVTCESENHQRDLYERFIGEGLKCRVLTL